MTDPKAVPKAVGVGNTHYAVVTFSGDLASEHPDEELRGQSPHTQFIACGPEQFCWDALVNWTAQHGLRQWEEAEVLARDPAVVRKAPQKRMIP